MTAYERHILMNQGELPLDDALTMLKPYHCAAGDDTQYWFEYAWGMLDDRGLTRIANDNPLELIFVHLGVLGLLTEEFQTKLLDEESLFEYEYAKYVNHLSIFDLENLHSQFFAADEVDDDLSEDERFERLAQIVIEGDRDRIVKALGMGSQIDEAFVALVLTVRFPCRCFNDYADQIESEFPVKVDDLRDRESFDSYEEYRKFLKTDDAADFVYEGGCGLEDPNLQSAFDWVQDGCPKLDVW